MLDNQGDTAINIIHISPMEWSWKEIRWILLNLPIRSALTLMVLGGGDHIFYMAIYPRNNGSQISWLSGALDGAQWKYTPPPKLHSEASHYYRVNSIQVYWNRYFNRLYQLLIMSCYGGGHLTLLGRRGLNQHAFFKNSKILKFLAFSYSLWTFRE